MSFVSFMGKNKLASKEDEKKFKATNKIGNYMWIDEENKLVKFSSKYKMAPACLIRFDEIKGYSLLEDGKEVVKNNGIKRAVVGSLLFGEVGAIVGATTSKTKQTQTIGTVLLFVELAEKYKNQVVPVYFAMGSKESINSSFYRGIKKMAQECMDKIDGITDVLSDNDYSKQSLSIPDEIRKYKELLDDGIITQEEFELKKEKLLG